MNRRTDDNLKPFDRMPPHDLDAEQALLGSLMLAGDNASLIGRISGKVWREAFYAIDHQILFDAVMQLYHAGKPIDLVSVHDRLKQMGVLEEIGGHGYIAQVASSMPTAAHAEHYAAIVSRHGRSREVLHRIARLQESLYTPFVSDVDGQVRQAASDLLSTLHRGAETDITTLGEAAERFVANREEGRGAAQLTGMATLDNAFPGLLRFRGYSIIAARPSMGKSAIIKHILRKLAEGGTPVGLIAVEEDADKIASDALSSVSGMTNTHVRDGALSHAEREHLAEWTDRLKSLPFHLTDSAQTADAVVTAVERLALQHGCRVIGIDHLHLIAARGNGGRDDNRHNQLTQISGELKAAFKRLDVCGLVAAQLKRTQQQRPQLSDLRESGSLEEHADVCAFLHRDDYFHRGDPGYQPDYLCDVMVMKNRGGPTGTVALRWHPKTQSYTDLHDERQQHTEQLL